MGAHVVTGAYGYSGQCIAKRLLDEGKEVRTLTNSVDRTNPFGDRVPASPFHFDDREKLVSALADTEVLYNTYWIRFNHDESTTALAVENSLKLFAAAKEAGVGRIVHVSILNPSEDSDLEYFSGKARLERELIATGLSYCILRPAVLFGTTDILVNNIAWSLRRLPAFGIFGDGKYKIQPIYVDDMAELAVREGNSGRDKIINAIGPETFTFKELVRTIARIIGKRRLLMRVPPSLGYLVASAIGRCMGDIFLTRDEIKGLMRGLLYVDAPPAGHTRLTDWAAEHADQLGRKYSSELARRRNRTEAYENL